jgi:hypothetical protein
MGPVGYIYYLTNVEQILNCCYNLMYKLNLIVYTVCQSNYFNNL